MSFNKFEKVSWSHGETLPSGFKCEVSDKSGILKITFPESYHSVMVFRDQVAQLGLTHPEIKDYVNRLSAHIKDAGESKQARKLNTAKQKLVNAILNNPALTDDQKQAMVKTIAA